MASSLRSFAGGLSEALQDLPRHRVALLCAAGLGVTAIASWMWWRRNRWELQQVGTVSQLLIYPIKSCRPVSVPEAECLELGLRHGELEDRHWLVVTEEGQMVTARQEPRLVLISVTGLGDSLSLEAPGMEKIVLPVSQPNTNKIMDCRVFGHDIQGRDCGDEVSKWLTSYFQSSKPYHLVHFEPGVMKPRLAKETEKQFRDKDVIAYPDASPVMLLSETSVEELNKHLEKPVTLGNFRPCIVVSGCQAFAEDGWEDVKVGTTVLKRVMSCGRCLLTTVDPDTGVMSRKEPLDTLRSFRMDPSQNKKSPLFGQYYGVERTGRMKVGDPVYIRVRQG
ncbi:mitochondrial amidoxime-reducing component 1-like [Hyperolius riggenbachi]|uniref:mitochondrial amidoxime-reducing component 1-like n=1 Tax=Hyperolius riggenbachi TaxID=752182 RepID=UPI0035A2FE67